MVIYLYTVESPKLKVESPKLQVQCAVDSMQWPMAIGQSLESNATASRQQPEVKNRKWEVHNMKLLFEPVGRGRHSLNRGTLE